MCINAKGLAVLLVGAVGIMGCGEDDPFTDADPRCAAACAIEEPPITDALDICSVDSARECLSQCATRIESVAPLCASCLVEQARFAPDGHPEFNWECDGATCWVTNGAEVCQYPRSDDVAREDCFRQLYPRREVACDVNWRPVIDCAEVCQ